MKRPTAGHAAPAVSMAREWPTRRPARLHHPSDFRFRSWASGCLLFTPRVAGLTSRVSGAVAGGALQDRSQCKPR